MNFDRPYFEGRTKQGDSSPSASSQATRHARTHDGGTPGRRYPHRNSGVLRRRCLLQDPNRETTAKAANGATHALNGADLAAVVPSPGKIICVGHNYRNHIKEMGGEVPAHPTLFAKYAESLTGPNDDLALPQESDAVDWEAELAVVIGKQGHRIAEALAADTSPATPYSTTSGCGTTSSAPSSGSKARRGRSPPRSAPPWSPRMNSPPAR